MSGTASVSELTSISVSVSVTVTFSPSALSADDSVMVAFNSASSVKADALWTVTDIMLIEAIATIPAFFRKCKN